MYILFPKSGCSTIRYLFQQLHYDELNHKDKQYIQDKKQFSFHGLEELSYITTNMENIKKYNHYYKISVVRNSYQRVCSMYFNRYLRLPDFAYSIYYNKETHKLKSDKSFREFVYNMKDGQGHFDPQVEPCEISKFIYLDKLYELYDVLKDIIKLPSEKLKIVDSILFKQCIKKECIQKNTELKNIKLCDYNFVKDTLDLDIINNGAPDYQLLYDESIKQQIYDKFKYEIDKHEFKFKYDSDQPTK